MTNKTATTRSQAWARHQEMRKNIPIPNYSRTSIIKTDERITSTLDVLQLKLATQQMWSSKTMDWIKRDGGMRMRENVATANRAYMRQYADMHIDAHRKKVVHGHPYLKLKLWRPSWNRNTTKTMDWIMVESKHCEVWSIMKEEERRIRHQDCNISTLMRLALEK